MKAPDLPLDEGARLERLRALKLLDTASDPRFDAVVRLACRTFGVPRALISLVDAHRQWFKAREGLDATETTRAVSFCGHAIHGTDTFVVQDATLDDRFADNPLVTSEPHVRFYAGQPLLAGPGQSAVGTLCLLDTAPRAFSEGDRKALADLGALVDGMLEERLASGITSDFAGPRVSLMPPSVAAPPAAPTGLEGAPLATTSRGAMPFGRRPPPLEWLADVAASIAAARTETAVVQAAVEALTPTVEAQQVGVYLGRPATGRMSLPHAHGRSETERAEAELTAHRGQAGWVWRTRMALRLDEGPAGTDGAETPIGARLWMPVASSSRCHGALELGLAHGSVIDEVQLQAVRHVCTLLAAGLDRIAGAAPRSVARLSRPSEQGIAVQGATLLDAAIDAVLSVGADGLVKSANPRAAALWGVPVQGLVGRPLSGLFDPPWSSDPTLSGSSLPFVTQTAGTLGAPMLLEVVGSVQRAGAEARTVLVARPATDASRWEHHKTGHAEVLLALFQSPAHSDGDTEAFSRKLTATAVPALDLARASVWLVRPAGEGGERHLECIDLFARAEGTHRAGMRLPEAAFQDEFERLRASLTVDVQDVQTDPRSRRYAGTAMAPAEVRSVLHAAVVTAGEVVGLVGLDHSGPARKWNDDEVAFARQLADQVGMVLLRQRQRVTTEALTARESELQTLLQASLDAVVILDEEGRVRQWDGRAEALFGFREEEVLSRPFVDVTASGDAARPLLDHLRQAVGPGHVPDARRPLALPATHRKGQRLDLEVSLSPVRFRGEACFAAFVHDVTQATRAARRAAVEHAAAEAAAGATSIEAFAERTLSAVLARQGWVAGSLFRVDAKGELLRGDQVTVREPGEFPRYAATTMAFARPIGRGIPGRVWKAERPEWVPDLRTTHDCPRALEAVADGLRSVCAVPVWCDGKITAVLEVAGEDVRAHDGEDEATLSYIAQQLGSFLSRLHAEAALRESERRLADTLLAAHAGAWSSDFRTGVVTWTDQVYQHLGYRHGEVVPGRTASDARIHPEDLDRVHATLAAAYSTGEPFAVEYRICRPDGLPRWLLDTGTFAFGPENRPVGVRAIMTDITARKAADAEIARLAAVAASTDNAVAIADASGRIEWVNESFVRQTGCTLEQVRGQRRADLLRSNATDPTADALLRESVQKGEGCSVELVCRTSGGRNYWSALELRPITDHDGRLAGFVTLESDITARKLTEQTNAIERKVASTLLTADDLGTAAPAILEVLSDTLNLPVAQLWVVDERRETLVHVAGHAREGTGEAGVGLIESSRATTFRKGTEVVVGVGIPGAAWGRGEATTVRHLLAMSRRAAHASALGVETFIGLPIQGPRGVLGVIELAGAALYPGHDLLAERLAGICEQIAQFMMRREERARFEALFEHSPDAVILVDSDGRVVQTSPRAIRLFGACKGKTIGTLLEGGGVLVGEVAHGPSSGSGPHSVGCQATDADGLRFPAEVSIARLGGEAAEHVVLSVRDLRARRRMEADLAAKQHRLQTTETALRSLERVLDASPVAMMIIDGTSRILHCNGEARRQFAGAPDRDLTGVSVQHLLPAFVLEQTLGAGLRADAQASRLDGTTFPAEFLARAIEDVGSLSVVLSVLDLTERKGVEQTLLAARDAAQAATAAKGQFLANMSHEIRTPLNVILGMSHLALDGTTTPAARRSFQKIHDAASGLRGILTDILDFSKIEAGKLSLESLDFSPEDVLHSAAELFALKAGEQGLELLVGHDLRMPHTVRGDPHRFAQVLRNLLSNALKFTRAGEVVLTAHVQRLDETGCVLACEVRDTGIGMSSEESAALFQPFSQADSSITRTFGGTGLGLAICKQLVEMMGGSISLSSELGRGTAVRFEVPFGAPGVEATPRAALAAELTGERLLVVDDHQGSREITCGLLRGLGLDPVGVHSGAQALSLVTGAARGSAPFSAVLTDGRLADVSAVELVRQLREAGFMGPVCLAATAAEQERAEATAEPCFAGVVSKPLRPSSLVDALVSGLRGVHRAPGPDPRRGPQPSFARHRVLLVEDNEDNREIAGELLRRMGVTVTLACDGSEALARVEQTPVEPGRRPFDLVLMDVQMPVVDGLSATRSIRALPDPARASVPIVAMTAHGMVGDREKSLQAGMQDHITKPIEPEALVRVLSQWKPPETEAVLLDLAGGLRRVGGNEALYHGILRRFCARHAEGGARMRALFVDAPADATALAHDIKGTAANLGLDGLSAGAAALEQALRSGRPSEALLDAFEIALGNTLRAVHAAVGEATTVAHAPDGRGAGSELLDLLIALEEPLRRRLAVRCREIAARLGGRGWDERYAEDVRALSAALTGYRFESATAIRAQLLSTLEGAEAARPR